MLLTARHVVTSQILTRNLRYRSKSAMCWTHSVLTSPWCDVGEDAARRNPLMWKQSECDRTVIVHEMQANANHKEYLLKRCIIMLKFSRVFLQLVNSWHSFRWIVWNLVHMCILVHRRLRDFTATKTRPPLSLLWRTASGALLCGHWLLQGAVVRALSPYSWSPPLYPHQDVETMARTILNVPIAFIGNIIMIWTPSIIVEII